MSRLEYENLAIMFRRNDPNLGHVSILNAMNKAGLAYIYGVLRATPRHHKQKQAILRKAIAFALDDKARAASH